MFDPEAACPHHSYFFAENHKILLAELNGMCIELSKECKEQQLWQFHFPTDGKNKEKKETNSVTHNCYTGFCGIA